MDIRVKVDAAKVTQEFKEARRDLNRRTAEGLREAGRLAVLPEVKQRARGRMPAEVVDALTVRATARRGYVAIQGARKLDRIGGLLNYGGVVETKILPKQKQALTIGDTGDVRASVSGPRRYKGSHVFEEGVEAGLPALERLMLPSIMRAFDGLEHQP